MMKAALLVAGILIASSQAQAVTINFETTDSGAATVPGQAVAAGDYDLFGASFTNAFYFRCGGGCPAPSQGIFVGGSGTTSPFTFSLTSGTTNLFSFDNVSNSSGTATAFDAASAVLTSVAFSSFPGTFQLSATGIKSVQFTGPQFGVDNFSYDLATPVPEPATWAMMLGGVGLIGGAMRRRQRHAVRVSYAG